MKSILLLGLVSSAYGYCVYAYTKSADCTGESTKVCAPLDKCITTQGSSTSVKYTACKSGTGGLTGTAYSNDACTGSGTAISVDEGKCSGGNGISTKTTCSGCFSPASTMNLPDGTKKAISELRSGDAVMSVDASGNMVVDKVFRVTEHDEKQETMFVRLTTRRGQVLELTNEHFVFAGSCCDARTAKAAHEVKVGDVIYTSVAGRVESDSVVKVEDVAKRGIFNVHTLSGNVVVDGVAATHFTSETTWTQKALAPWWYAVINAVSPLVDMRGGVQGL